MSSSNVCHRSGELILPPKVSKYNIETTQMLNPMAVFFCPEKITSVPGRSPDSLSCSTLARCVMVPMNVQPWKKRAKVEAKNQQKPWISKDVSASSKTY